MNPNPHSEMVLLGGVSRAGVHVIPTLRAQRECILNSRRSWSGSYSRTGAGMANAQPVLTDYAGILQQDARVTVGRSSRAVIATQRYSGLTHPRPITARPRH